MICPADNQPCTGTMDARCHGECSRLAAIRDKVRPAMEGLFAVPGPIIGKEAPAAGRDQVDDLSGFPFQGKPKVEPPQEMRQGATMMFQWFTALVDAGFTEGQALKIIALGMNGDDNADD